MQTLYRILGVILAAMVVSAVFLVLAWVLKTLIAAVF